MAQHRNPMDPPDPLSASFYFTFIDEDIKAGEGAVNGPRQGRYAADLDADTPC